MTITDEALVLPGVICDLMDEFVEVGGSKVTAVVEDVARTLDDREAIAKAARARLGSIVGGGSGPRS